MHSDCGGSAKVVVTVGNDGTNPGPSTGLDVYDVEKVGVRIIGLQYASGP